MVEEKTSLKTNSLKWLYSGFFQFLGYYNQGLFNFIKTTDANIEFVATNEVDFTPRILIVGRRHYSELNRSYPIESASEVKKLINLEYAGQRLHYKLGKVENGKTLVNIWLFKEEVPNSLLTVPESFLFSNLTLNEQILTIHCHPPLFVAMQNTIIYSQTSNAMISSQDSFAMSVGMPLANEQIVIEDTTIAENLLKAIKKLTLKQIGLFWSWPKVEFTRQSFKVTLGPALVLGILYLLGSSLYLSGYKTYLQTQIEQQSDSIDFALDSSNQMERLNKQYKVSLEFAAAQLNVAAIWYVLPDILPDAELSRFELIQGRFVVAGKTERATSLLEKLSKNPYVNDARFDNPTRASRGSEYFAISFSVKPLIVEQSNQTGGINNAGN